jgi:hypothetical protein
MATNTVEPGPLTGEEPKPLLDIKTPTPSGEL